MMKNLFLVLLAFVFAVTGAQGVLAQVDEDGDGYNAGIGPGWDCDDDPSDDPVPCDVCTCDEDICAPCARCIHPGAIDICFDGIDGNCDPDTCSCENDDDGDGYVANWCGGPDCDDDPSDDPAICGTCTCGNEDCKECARCINPAATEFPDDNIDNNCNGQADHFIAHAAFGTPSEPKLKLMRNFRDDCLLKSETGRRLVILYYRASPPWADFINRHESLRIACRILLQPLFGIMWILLHL